MLLKSLEIQGFKTFPDKTKLTFDKGITSVVGPNGSGKSNISDAIRWVLGEQSTKSLRCAKMEDVVFKGTDKRKKNGYAEVTLTIENKDRTLPYDGDDVSVTRRYYRSGESEYLINKAVVRLKDIHELFMDTGLGRDGYSMISQGKIDSIVSSKSEERRDIFEEAAGISRYRYRKSEAERRLKSTEENLCRLRDILSELETRVEPLRIQSEKATKFLEYSKEKRGLEIALWLDTLEKSAIVLREQEDKISVAKAQYDDAEKELSDIREKTEEFFRLSAEKTALADQVRQEISSAEVILNEIKEKISLANNDISHNKETIERYRNEISLTEASKQTLDETKEQKLQQISEIKKKIEENLSEYAKKAESLNVVNEDALSSSEKAEQLNSKLALLNAKSADARVEEMTASGTLSEIATRLVALMSQKKESEESINKLTSYIDELKSMIKDCDDKSNSLEQSLNGCKMLYDSRIKKAQSIKEQADKLMLDARENERRTKILEDLEKNLEGFSNSVKSVMKEMSRGVLSGIIGPVSRVISVSAEYSTAIEIALGASMQNIVCEDERSAKNAIAYLKRVNGGRATFLPISNIRGSVLNENGLDKCEGFIGIANTLCTFESKYENIINNLLGRTVIVSDINRATEIAKKYSYRFKIVTLDGQVVNAGGSLTGGSFGKKSGILSRASEIERIKELAIKLHSQADEAYKDYNETMTKSEKIKADMLIYESEMSNSREDRIKFATELTGRETELANAKRTLDALIIEEKTSTERNEALRKAKDNAHIVLQELNEKIAETETALELISGNREEITKRREDLSAQLESLRLKTAVFEKEIDALKAEIATAEAASTNQDERRVQIENEISEIEKISSDIESKIQQYLLDTEKHNKTIEELKVKMSSLYTERTALERQSVDLRTKERDKQNERENTGKELARLEERKINLQKRYDEIIAKLWEEYELTKSEAEREQIAIEDITLANKRLSELKGKIKNLGSINVGAIEEYKEVYERYVFLSGQVKDVESSKDDIISLIKDLTKQMSALFIQRFAEINENFSKTFKELFGGGRASLELTDPNDILNTGIEIICNPPGKIVEHLELLSGGEKALVAIALYFAILKVSPAPFCVMDEIEAALDDVNVYRFAAYLRRMNDKTQFILITHRRGTMEESDVLYGVTMQDEGISKLLELRATEVAEKLGKLE